MISTVVLPAHHAGVQIVLWNMIFLNICLNTFLASLISDINQLWGSSFFGKPSTFNADFKNAKKKSEKFSCFWHNRILNGSCKLSLLRREYLSRPVNALRNRFETLHISKRGFLQRSFLHGYQKLLMVLFSIYEQCLLPFTRRLVKVFCEAGLLLMR